MLIKIITKQNGKLNNQFCQLEKESEFSKTLRSNGHEILETIYEDHTNTHGLDFSKQESKTKAFIRNSIWY